MNEKPQLIECVRLKAKLTPLACLTNRIKAAVLMKYPNIGPGLLRPCISCKIGRKVQAYLPGDQA